MAKIRRGGDNYRSSPRGLPPAQEYVHRLTELDTGRSRHVNDVFTGAWGRSGPIQGGSFAGRSRPGATYRIETALARYGLRPRQTYPLAERLLHRSQGYAMLRQLQIKAPLRVKFCRQRKERREVLFAFNRAGFSGSAPKRHYRRTQDSQYGC